MYKISPVRTNRHSRISYSYFQERPSPSHSPRESIVKGFPNTSFGSQLLTPNLSKLGPVVSKVMGSPILHTRGGDVVEVPLYFVPTFQQTLMHFVFLVQDCSICYHECRISPWVGSFVCVDLERCTMLACIKREVAPLPSFTIFTKNESSNL